MFQLRWFFLKVKSHCSRTLRCHLESLVLFDRWSTEPKHGQIWKDLLPKSSRKLQRVKGTVETKSQVNHFPVQYFLVGLLVYLHFCFWGCEEMKGKEKEGWKNVVHFQVIPLHPYLHAWVYISVMVFQPRFKLNIVIKALFMLFMKSLYIHS